jgi:hypothetical protein
MRGIARWALRQDSDGVPRQARVQGSRDTRLLVSHHEIQTRCCNQMLSDSGCGTRLVSPTLTPFLPPSPFFSFLIRRPCHGGMDLGSDKHLVTPADAAIGWSVPILHPMAIHHKPTAGPGPRHRQLIGGFRLARLKEETTGWDGTFKFLQFYVSPLRKGPGPRAHLLGNHPDSQGLLC